MKKSFAFREAFGLIPCPTLRREAAINMAGMAEKGCRNLRGLTQKPHAIVKSGANLCSPRSEAHSQPNS